LRKKSKGRVKKFDEEHNIVEFKKRDTAKLERIEGLDGHEVFDPERSFNSEEFIEEFIDEGLKNLEDEDEQAKGDYKADEYDALDIRRTKEESVRDSAKKSRKRKRIMVYIAVIILLIAVLAIPVHRIVSLKIEENHLKAEQKELQQQKKELKEDLQKVNDPEYIEQQARKQLNLVKPGETLYVLPNSEDKDGSQ
jgi:cell division protein DivIC